MAEQWKTAGLSTGDWVSGTSVNDERIRGFVRHYDLLANIFTVTVVESDRPEAVGRTVFARPSHISALPEDGAKHPEALRELIDLALMMKDEAWFYELTAELQLSEAQFKYTV